MSPHSPISLPAQVKIIWRCAYGWPADKKSPQWLEEPLRRAAVFVGHAVVDAIAPKAGPTQQHPYS